MNGLRWGHHDWMRKPNVGLPIPGRCFRILCGGIMVGSLEFGTPADTCSVGKDTRCLTWSLIFDILFRTGSAPDGDSAVEIPGVC